MMTLPVLLPLMLLTAEEPKWKLDAESDQVKVYARAHDGSAVREMKAEGLIDAPPEVVWKVVRDYDSYTKVMPYVVEAKILSRTEGDKLMLVYNRLETPLVASRDYIIAIRDESDWKDGKGYFKSAWTCADKEADAQLPEKKDVVRVRINDGYWQLEPRDDGKKTFATYYLYTAAGGSIPIFAINAANGMAVPRVFQSIRKNAATRK